MSNQLDITGGARVRGLNGVITGTTGVLNSLPINSPNGIPQLDSSGKILVSQLPNSVMEFLGTWNAATNTPTLADGTGNAGDVYLCNVAGTVNFGSGPITFQDGDYVVYSGTTWERSGGAMGTVTSVAASINGNSIGLTGSPITTAGTLAFAFAGTNLQYVNGAGNLTTFPTLITSVGLSMPSAFTVTNSPLTANGTIAVTGAGTASQYIRGDGQLATFPTTGGGGSAIYYYLNGSIPSSVAGYQQMSNTAIVGAGTDFALSGNGLIAQFLTDIGNPNRNLIPSGAWNFEMFFSSSSNGGNEKFYLELVKYNGSTFTTIASTITNPEAITGGTTTDLYITSMAVPETTLLVTDRLAVRVYVVDNSGARTITLHTEDNNLCQITTTFSAGISSINGLTENTQYFAVGTAGSDFNINSLVDTHTFNLPTASATNRGALSSADWSLFNGKADNSLVVHLAGTETITGNKTFSVDSVTNFNGAAYFNYTTIFSNRLSLAWGAIASTSGYLGFSGNRSGSITTFALNDGNTGKAIQFNFTNTFNGTKTYTLPDVTGTIALTSDIPSLAGYVPTSRTLTINGTTYDLSADRSWSIDSMVYPSAGIAVSTGTAWGTSLVDNSANWNTAYSLRITSATAPLSITSNVISISQATTSTSGYLTFTDWNTFNNKQDALTNPVTGTGTTNYLPIFTGATTLGNSNIRQSGTSVLINKPLGSSEYIFEVVGDSYFTGNGIFTDSIGSGGNAVFSYNLGAYTIIGSGAVTANKFQVYGNAGIVGNLTASSLIKSGGTSAQILAADGSVITAGTNITISGGTISASGGGGGSMAIGGAITSATAGSVLFAGASGILQQDNANLFWDDTNNMFSIGTNVPSYKLHVKTNTNGNIGFRNPTDFNATWTTGSAIGVFNDLNSANEKLYIESSQLGLNLTSTANTYIGGNVGINTQTIGDSKFQVFGNAAIGYSASTAAPSLGMVVKGHLLVGTSTDVIFGGGAELVVKGGTAVANIWNGRAIIGGDSVAFLMGQFNFGATAMAWLGGHNAALNAWADIYISPDGNTQKTFIGSRGGYASGPAMTIQNSNGSIGVNTSTIGSKIQVNGNAAIGYSASTAAPTNGLLVAGDIQIGATKSFLGTAGSYFYIGYIAANGPNINMSSPTRGGGPYFISYDHDGGHRFSNSNESSVWMTINSSGNVGIGATTIGSKFQVNGNAAIGYSASTAAPTNGLQVAGDIQVAGTGSSTTTPRVVGVNGFGAGNAARFQFGDLLNCFQNSNGGLMQIISYHGMQIYGGRGAVATSFAAGVSTDPSLLITGTEAARPVLVVKAAVSQSANIQEWRNSSNTILNAIDSTGDLGLGTTTIGSKLQINGNAAIGYSASTAAPTNGLKVAGAAIFDSTITSTGFASSGISGGSNIWNFGTIINLTAALDTTKYLTINVNGVDYKLALII